MYVKNSYVHNFTIHTGIRVQSLTKGQIIMDVDLRWGGDPSIILAVEAALVASIPIQVCLAECFLLNTNITSPFFIFVKIWFLLLLFASVEGSKSFHHCPCYIPTCWRDPLHFCCCCCSSCWGNLSGMLREIKLVCMWRHEITYESV